MNTKPWRMCRKPWGRCVDGFTSLFAGMDFPASRKELKDHARGEASDDEMDKLDKFSDQTYNSMADVAKELGRVS